MLNEINSTFLGYRVDARYLPPHTTISPDRHKRDVWKKMAKRANTAVENGVGCRVTCGGGRRTRGEGEGEEGGEGQTLLRYWMA